MKLGERQSTKQKSKKGQITGLDNYSKRNHLRTPRTGLDFSMINEFNLAMWNTIFKIWIIEMANWTSYTAKVKRQFWLPITYSDSPYYGIFHTKFVFPTNIWKRFYKWNKQQQRYVGSHLQKVKQDIKKCFTFFIATLQRPSFLRILQIITLIFLKYNRR